MAVYATGSYGTADITLLAAVWVRTDTRRRYLVRRHDRHGAAVRKPGDLIAEANSGAGDIVCFGRDGMLEMCPVDTSFREGIEGGNRD